MLKVKIQKGYGRNNNYINIPKDVEEELGLKVGDTIKFVLKDSGAVELRKQD